MKSIDPNILNELVDKLDSDTRAEREALAEQIEERLREALPDNVRVESVEIEKGMPSPDGIAADIDKIAELFTQLVADHTKEEEREGVGAICSDGSPRMTDDPEFEWPDNCHYAMFSGNGTTTQHLDSELFDEDGCRLGDLNFSQQWSLALYDLVQGLMTGEDPSVARARAFNAINTERVYQDRQFGDSLSSGREPGEGDVPGQRSIDEWALYIAGYTTDLVSTASHSTNPHAKLEMVRKIGAMAVACMEQHGAPERMLPNAEPVETAR